MPLSVARIGVGLVWLAFFVVTAPNWERFYGFDGILSMGENDLNIKRNIATFSVIGCFDGIFHIHIWWWIGVILSLFLTLGFHTRIATIGMFVFVSSLIQRNTAVVNGEELVTRMLLFYGCFSPWGNRLSLDSYLRKRAHPACNELPLVWSWRLMQINFLMIYAISLPYKFSDDIDWLTGDALHWTIASDMWWSRGWLSDLTLAYNGALRKLMTWGTVLVEGLFPILVCFRWTRAPIAFAVMSLHLGIAFCIPGVTLFTLSMVVGATLFVPASTWQTLLASVRIHPRCRGLLGAR